MGLIDRVARRLGYAKVAAGRRAAGFDAAQISRLTASWTTQNVSADQDIYRHLAVLRARSRHLCYNNEFAKKFLQMCSTHIVGPNGFNLQMQIRQADGSLDQTANTAIETGFWRWARLGVCELSRKLSFVGLTHLLVKAIARDGEALLRKVYGRSANPYGFGLQLLDIDRLDINRNEELRNGNLIKMGVEISPVGAPVAYHLLTKHPGDSVYATYQGVHYERVPAQDIYHLGIPDRPEQTRFVPWMHAAMMRLQNLGGYEEAAVIAARVGAAKMGVWETPDGNPEPLGNDKDADGTTISDAEPGQFALAPPGYKLSAWDPDYPHEQYDGFVKACLRGVASGVGVAYNTLANDLEGVNFSSIRSGVLEERDNWMVLQNWLIEAFLVDVFENFLKFALINDRFRLPNGDGLPVTKFDEFNQPQWRGRRWQWVDPEKDVNANVTATKNGLKSRRQIIGEQGGDIEDVWAELAAEEKKAKELGLVLGEPPAPKPPAVNPAADDEAKS